jgi:hypothetical protein
MGSGAPITTVYRSRRITSCFPLPNLATPEKTGFVVEPMNAGRLYLSGDAAPNPFHYKRQLADLDYATSSTAALTSLAEKLRGTMDIAF